MSERPQTRTSGLFQNRYREITWEAVVFGVVIGIVMNAAITYSGLKIGFTIGGSAIAAVLGWGVLRGILRKGTIVETNIAQTVASTVNTSNSGLIFTVPELGLRLVGTFCCTVAVAKLPAPTLLLWPADLRKA